MIRTDTRLDGLLLGGALALLLERSAVRQFILRKFTKEMPWVLALLISINLLWTHLNPTFTTYLLLALMLAYTVVVGERLPHQWLNSRPLIWLGSISYSVYLWNQLFLLHPAGSPALGRFSELPLSLLCVFVAASCSYYLIERPVIALGKRHYATNV
jgi:peptidoglycan/LPS O-acetylase OafA/YrhL